MDTEALRKAIRQMVKDMVPVVTEWAEVVSVDEEKITMVVKDLDELLEVEGVLLNVDDIGGVTVFPKVGSRVLIGAINGSNTNYFMIMASEVDKIKFNGHEHGGILISQNTANKLNALEQDLNTVKSIFASWVPVPNDGGALLKSLITSWASSQLTVTQKTDLENEKVLHG